MDGGWPAKARQAALELSGSEDTEALGTNAQLLTDIRRAFDEAGTDRLASKDVCARLVEMEGRPWAEFGKSRKPISANQLANLLREFSIASRGVRIGDATPRGYTMDDFADAFSRYSPGNVVPKCNNATRPASIEESPPFGNATPPACCTSENPVSPNDDVGCCIVAFQKTGKDETTPEFGQADLI